VPPKNKTKKDAQDVQKMIHV